MSEIPQISHRAEDPQPQRRKFSKPRRAQEYKVIQDTSTEVIEVHIDTSYDDNAPKQDNLNRSSSNISSVFISPGKGKRKEKDRFVKIREKVLHPGSDMSHSVEWSSFNKKGEENSMATLSKEFDPSEIGSKHHPPMLKNTLGKATNFDVVQPKADNPIPTDMSIEKPEPRATSAKTKSNSMINLENVLIIEEKIREIYDSLSTFHKEISLLCEDWWEVTQEETALAELGNLFKEPIFK